MSTGVVTSFLAAFSSLSRVPTPLLGLCDCDGWFYVSAELRDTQMAGKTSLGVFLAGEAMPWKDISIWMSRLSQDGPNWGHYPAGDLNRTKRLRKSEFALSAELRHLSSLPLDTGAPGLWPVGLRPGLTLLGPDSQAFRLRVNYTSRFPGCPAWRRQMVVLLSLHNHASQLL